MAQKMVDGHARSTSWGGCIGVLLVLVVASFWAPAVLAQSSKQVTSGDTVAKSARLGGDRLRTRFVADLSEKVPFRVFTLGDPYRVIVDLPDVKFQLPSGLGRKGRGLVKAFRYGRFAPGKSRIVIDVVGPVAISKSFVLKAQNGQPARLVIDLVPTDEKTFLAKLAKGHKKKLVAKKSAAPDPLANLSENRPKGRKRKPVIVIDPGHGGIDPGAVSPSGTTEKKVVFELAKQLRDALKSSGQYHVHMTRDIDTFVRLGERVKFARKKRASLFISVHADIVPGRGAKGVRGASVYTLSEKASDTLAKKLAAKENRSDILAGVELSKESSPVRNILISLAQRETKNHSIGYAHLLGRHLKSATKLNKQPYRFANFAVLRAPDVPSVLLELGYLSSKEDEKLLKSNAWRQKTAKAMVRSINAFFAKGLDRAANE